MWYRRRRPTAAANGGIKAHYVCVYDSTTGVGQSFAPSSWARGHGESENGPTGGGNQVTVSGPPNPALFTGATVGALFTNGVCAASYGTPATPNLVANAVKQPNGSVNFTVPPGAVTSGPNGANQMMYNVCLYDSNTQAGALLSYAPYMVNLVTLNVSSGSSLTANGITATAPTPFLSGAIAPTVLLVGNAGCPGNYSTSPINGTPPTVVSGIGVRRLTNNRAAVTIPPLSLNGQPSQMYQMCFYGSTTGMLLGTAVYTATVVANPIAVMPAAGPATGGNVITVVGTDFPTDPGRITATLGGTPLTDIQSQSDKSFTARVPAHAVADNVTLVVTTPQGTKALQGAYSFVNPVKVVPNTAPNTAPTVDVDVQGMNFFSLGFGTGGNSARVFLVNGAYNGIDVDSGIRANGPVAECTNVLPISDEELVCTLQLNRRLGADGTFFNPVGYTKDLVDDITTSAGSAILSSTNALFSPGDVGQVIVEDGGADHIPDGATITQVLGAKKAVMSAPAKADGVDFGAVIGGPPVHSFNPNSILTTADSTAVTLAAGAFTGADVGRVFDSTAGIAGGTTIVAARPAAPAPPSPPRPPATRPPCR